MIIAKDGGVWVDGVKASLPGLRIEAEIARGANGIVFPGHDEVLDRPIAVKIWTKLKRQDQRDKALQGLQEVRKLTAAKDQPRGEFFVREPYEHLCHSAVAEVYSAGTLDDGSFYSVMEFIDGVTLKTWLEENELPIGRKFYIAEALTELDAQWAKADLYHGDLHWKNVMIENDRRQPNYWEVEPRPPRIRVLDFGTSYFSKETKTKSRHFRVLAETVERCIKPIPLNQIIPNDKPNDLGTEQTRTWLQKSLCAFRAALFLCGKQSVGWPYSIDGYAGFKVPSHTDVEPAKMLVKAFGLDKRLENEQEAIGYSRQWSEFDGRHDKLPGD